MNRASIVRSRSSFLRCVNSYSVMSFCSDTSFQLFSAASAMAVVMAVVMAVTFAVTVAIWLWQWAAVLAKSMVVD